MKIKPCPFCGGKAKLLEVDSDIDPSTGAIESNAGGRFIECQSCHASSAIMFPLMEPVDHLLEERWNRRTVTRGGGA